MGGHAGWHELLHLLSGSQNWGTLRITEVSRPLPLQGGPCVRSTSGTMLAKGSFSPRRSCSPNSLGGRQGPHPSLFNKGGNRGPEWQSDWPTVTEQCVAVPLGAPHSWSWAACPQTCLLAGIPIRSSFLGSLLGFPSPSDLLTATGAEAAWSDGPRFPPAVS